LFTPRATTDFGLLAQSELFSDDFAAQELCHADAFPGFADRATGAIRRLFKWPSTATVPGGSSCLMTGLVVHNAAAPQPKPIQAKKLPPDDAPDQRTKRNELGRQSARSGTLIASLADGLDSFSSLSLQRLRVSG
jgi:hypothetical protein